MKESIIKSAQFLTMPATVFMLAVVSLVIPGISQEVIALTAVLISAGVKKYMGN